MRKFNFPKDSWDQSLTECGDSYVAMWDDADGSHIVELDRYAVDEYEPYNEDDYADGMISDPGAWYED